MMDIGKKYEELRMRCMQSELNFGLYQRIHLMHVTSYPHEPHLEASYRYSHHRNSTLSQVYLLFASLLSSVEF
jgi:hypothetical protein